MNHLRSNLIFIKNIKFYFTVYLKLSIKITNKTLPQKNKNKKITFNVK